MLYGALPTTGVNYRPIQDPTQTRIEDYAFEVGSFMGQCYFDKLLSQRGKPYDYSALAGIVLHRDWGTDDSRWFCSELIAWAAQTSGIHLLRTEHKNRITPNHLLMSPLLRRIA